MIPTPEAALSMLAAHLDDDAADAHVIAAALAGRQMVADHLGPVGIAAIPQVLGDLAVVEAGAAVYYRRTARNGIATFGSGEVMPMRISKDPMSTVYPILAPYATPGISR